MHRIREIFLDIVVVLLGTFVYAAGLYFFIEPASIAPGGVSGIALMVNYLTHAPIGVVSACINIPLILIGYRFVGREFIWKTLLSIAAFTVIYDYILCWFPVYQGERLLSCIFGGVIWGLGIGLVFLRSGSTGGTDILVSWQVSGSVHSLVGYTLNDGQPVEIMRSGYSRYLTADLDSDGQQEVILSQTESGAGTHLRIEYYDCRDGRMEMTSVVPLSEGATGVNSWNDGQLAGEENITVYHSGTAIQEDGTLVTNGGRVLGVTATADRLTAAITQAYAAAEKISFEKLHKRTDIGFRALKAIAEKE